MNLAKRISIAGVLLTLAVVSVATVAARAGAPFGQSQAPHRHEDSSAVGKVDLAAIREATKRFQNFKVAEEEGYTQFLGCVSGPNGGAMGIHFANGNLMGDGELDLLKPDVLIYEPNGDKLQLVGMEYVVIAEAWHAKNQMPPVLDEQLLYYAASPNRYGMPPHYEMHIWAWRNNPTGTFADWNPKVACGN